MRRPRRSRLRLQRRCGGAGSGSSRHAEGHGRSWNVYIAQAKYPQAEEAVFSRNLEIERRVLGPEDPQTLRGMNNLGLVVRHVGKYALAEPLYNQLTEIDRRAPVLSTPPRCRPCSVWPRSTRARANMRRPKIFSVRYSRSTAGYPVPSIPTLFCAWATWPVRTPLKGKYAVGEALYTKTAGSKAISSDLNTRARCPPGTALAQTLFMRVSTHKPKRFSARLQRSASRSRAPRDANRTSSYLAYTDAAQGDLVPGALRR